VVLRGLLGIAIGIVTFVSPVATLAALVMLFGAYAFIDGVLSVVGAVRAGRVGDRWGVLLLEGIAGIAAGVIALLSPALTVTVLVLVIAAWAFVTGVLEVIAAIRLRKEIRGEWLLALFGVMSIIFGLLVASVPLVGALVIATWVGAYAFVSGVILVALGFRLRSRLREIDDVRRPMAA
jgi:uncharacterized membrane protein HdeD (DUF308 family)